MMTKDEIVDHMISYIETVEKDLQASKTSSDGKAGKNRCGKRNLG